MDENTYTFFTIISLGILYLFAMFYAKGSPVLGVLVTIAAGYLFWALMIKDK